MNLIRNSDVVVLCKYTKAAATLCKEVSQAVLSGESETFEKPVDLPVAKSCRYNGYIKLSSYTVLKNLKIDANESQTIMTDAWRKEGRGINTLQWTQ